MQVPHDVVAGGKLEGSITVTRQKENVRLVSAFDGSPLGASPSTVRVCLKCADELMPCLRGRDPAVLGIATK